MNITILRDDNNLQAFMQDFNRDLDLIEVQKSELYHYDAPDNQVYLNFKNHDQLRAFTNDANATSIFTTGPWVIG